MLCSLFKTSQYTNDRLSDPPQSQCLAQCPRTREVDCTLPAPQVVGSVRYGASRAPKTAGPRPCSPPHLAERPGVGRLYKGFLAPASGPSHSPAGPPLKIGGAIWGPFQGMSGSLPRTGEGAGTTLNIAPPAGTTAGPCE